MLGLFFMIMSFVATEVRGPFSKLPGPPPSMSQRVIFFLVGVAACVKGLQMLVG